MSTTQRRPRKRKRKCMQCNEFFMPDARNRWHQHYCSKDACSKASKRAAQRRWLLSEKGKGYFQGPDNIDRVRQWRSSHPGYSSRQRSLKAEALKDVFPVQPIVVQQDKPVLALKDIISLQPAIIIGLISHLTGNTLQDDIADNIRAFVSFGNNILGVNPIVSTKGGP